jgi:hypothetical protein
MAKLISHCRRALAYLQWFWYWSVEIVVVLAVAGATVLALWPGITEKWLRYFGMIYLLAGTGYGVWALYQLRTLFGMPSTSERFRAWLAARPRDVVIQLSGQTASFSGGQATLTPWIEMAVSPDQLKALIANVNYLRKALQDSNVEHRTAAQKLRTDLDAAKSASEASVAHVSKLLKSAHTDGLGWALAAIVCLIIGTVLTAIAPDVGKHAEPATEYLPIIG